jgi:hypothetical protein
VYYAGKGTEIHTLFWAQKRKEKDQVEDLGIGEKIILKQTPNK